MAHGRTIGEQSVTATDGSVSFWQSSDKPELVFLSVGYDGETREVYLTPEQAFELARKLTAEAGHAWRAELDGKGELR